MLYINASAKPRGVLRARARNNNLQLHIPGRTPSSHFQRPILLRPVLDYMHCDLTEGSSIMQLGNAVWLVGMLMLMRQHAVLQQGPLVLCSEAANMC